MPHHHSHALLLNCLHALVAHSSPKQIARNGFNSTLISHRFLPFAWKWAFSLRFLPPKLHFYALHEHLQRHYWWFDSGLVRGAIAAPQWFHTPPFIVSWMSLFNRTLHFKKQYNQNICNPINKCRYWLIN